MTVLDKNQQKKILTSGVMRIMNALRSEGEVRVVGGAVRDMLMSRKVGDIDLATNLLPDRVMEILSSQGMKTVPTGLAHGTITVVIDHVGYEITTLRRDVETDGRHAKVEFTDDWHADAARRDFTFNALYVDADGKLYDYFDGQKDADAGRVRFIGDARVRIREDVLRILRFFRFTAWFGRGEPGGEALGACHELANLIPNLSAERVAKEALKLLAAPDPLLAWKLMVGCNATIHFLSEASDVDRLAILLRNEQENAEQQSSLTRLAALLPQDESAAATIATRLKLSSKDSETLRILAGLASLLLSATTAKSLRRLLYSYGTKNCRAAAFLNDTNLHDSLATIDAWENPIFPIKGQDIVKLGIPVGPKVGDILRIVEEWWIEDDFHADSDACLAQAKNYVNNH